MHIRMIGDTHDVTGFALAGVEAEECHSRGDVLNALANAEHDPDLAILMLTPGVAALAGDVVELMRDGAHLPITIVLPDLPEEERTARKEPA